MKNAEWTIRLRIRARTGRRSSSGSSPNSATVRSRLPSSGHDYVPDETPEQLKARCLEHYKDRISADGPYRLVLEITDNLKTPPNAKPSLGLLVSLYNRAFSPLDQE